MKKNFSVLIILSMVLSLAPVQIFADDACSHVWSEWEVGEEPTCGEDGYEERYCINCGEEESKEIPATGDHDWDEWYISKSATVSKTGLKTRECLDCYETQEKTIPKLKPWIKLSKKTLTLKAPKSYTIKISYAKGDAVKKCESGNKAVATVSKNGKITAKSAGTTTITVTLKSGKKASCKVTVTAAKKKVPAKKKTPKKDSASGGTVYWTPGGAVYHSTKNCPTLSRSKTIYSGSVSDCPKPRPCKVCF